MSTLAIYDVLKIQEFIFASNKLSENLGASILVQQVFEKQLIEAIKAIVQDEAQRLTEWKNAATFKIAEPNSEIQAEIVYIGGGNAVVAYSDKERVAKRVTQELSRSLLNQTGGALQFAVAYHDTNFSNYQDDKKAIFKQLNQNKAQHIQSSPLSGIGITRPGNDGLPSVFSDSDEHDNPVFFSKVGKLKREIGKQKRDDFDKLLSEHTKDFVFPRELDELGQEKGDENYIAIVHIDGNNQGAMFDNAIGRANDYQEAVRLMRQMSAKIADIYEIAMKSLVQSLIEWVKKTNFAPFNYDKDRRYRLPIRPIVLNGDDVTFVSYGKFGISFAELFLKELDRISKQKELLLSACAGVAIVKSHFPFYRAYTLAEELCKSAKTKAKILAKNHKHHKVYDQEEAGSWLDFHIVQSGLTTDLAELRRQFYLIPSAANDKWTEPDALKEPKDAEYPDMKYEQYHLLWRPWRIVGTCEQCGVLYDWNELLHLWEALHPEIKQPAGQTQWKQSRLKRLRNSMIHSLEELNDLRQEFESRKFELPKFLGSQKIFKKRADKTSFRQTPYFDAIELLEYYEQIPSAKGDQEQ